MRCGSRICAVVSLVFREGWVSDFAWFECEKSVWELPFGLAATERQEQKPP